MPTLCRSIGADSIVRVYHFSAPAAAGVDLADGHFVVWGHVDCY